MPYYLISLKIKKKKPIAVVRQYANSNLEHIYVWLRSLSLKQYGESLEKYNCVMISKNSEEAREFIAARGKTADGWELDDLGPTKIAGGYQPRKSKGEGNWGENNKQE
jgi:hypothetical protein